MRLTSPKVHLSKTIHDLHRPLRIVPYRAIMYTSFSKRTQMTVTWSNKQVNNSLIASRQAYIYTLIYIGDQCIVHKIGSRNRHWGTFARRCINNRTIMHDAKGAVPIVSCFRKCTFGEVHRMQFILFLCVFISDGALIWRRCQKFVSGLIIMLIIIGI